MRRAGIMVADSAAELRPISQVLEAYVGQLDQRGDHHRIVRWRLGRAVEAAGWAVPRDITPESVNRHLDALRVKPRTRNQVRAAIGSWCDWMMRQRPPLLASNPLLHVATAPETRDPMRWPLGDAEFEALLAAEPTKHGDAWRLRRLAYLLAGEAGLRRSDCKHLTAGRVRLAGVSPFVELPSDVNKSRRWQQVPLTPRLAEAQLPKDVHFNAQGYDMLGQKVAESVTDAELSPTFVVPSVFDRSVVQRVAPAVSAAAIADGVTRIR
jgi:integrase